MLYERTIAEFLPDVERLQQFMKYLIFEQSSGDPACVQVLYECAIAQFLPYIERLK